MRRHQYLRDFWGLSVFRTGSVPREFRWRVSPGWRGVSEHSLSRGPLDGVLASKKMGGGSLVEVAWERVMMQFWWPEEVQLGNVTLGIQGGVLLRRDGVLGSRAGRSLARNGRG